MLPAVSGNLIGIVRELSGTAGNYFSKNTFQVCVTQVWSRKRIFKTDLEHLKYSFFYIEKGGWPKYHFQLWIDRLTIKYSCETIKSDLTSKR